MEGEAAVLVHSAAQCCVDSCVRNQVKKWASTQWFASAVYILSDSRVDPEWKGLALTQLPALLQGWERLLQLC